jgi:Group II intron, maturase-specific domain
MHNWSLGSGRESAGFMKSLQREKAVLTEMTASRMGLVPIDLLIARINRHLKGWMNYFRLGYPYDVFQKIGHHVRSRMIRHLRRRSQRPFRFPEGQTTYRFLAELGLLDPAKTYTNSRRKPAAKVSGNAGCGNPPVRCDEGRASWLGTACGQ